MPKGPKCSMHMLWNTQIEDTCVVFQSWHISSKTTLFFSCLAIVALGVLYEYLRQVQRTYDQNVARHLMTRTKGKAVDSRRGSRSNSPETEDAGLLSGRRVSRSQTSIPAFERVIRAALYASTITLSFFLMLVFMTYNAYLIAAVVIGAGVGHYIFSPTMNVEAVLAGAEGGGKSMACH